MSRLKSDLADIIMRSAWLRSLCFLTLTEAAGTFWKRVDTELFVCLFVCLQLAQSVIELNNQIQQKDKEIQTNEAKSVSEAGSPAAGDQHDSICCVRVFQDVGVPAADLRPGGRLPGPEELPAGRRRGSS